MIKQPPLFYHSPKYHVMIEQVPPLSPTQIPCMIEQRPLFKYHVAQYHVTIEQHPYYHSLQYHVMIEQVTLLSPTQTSSHHIATYFIINHLISCHDRASSSIITHPNTMS